MNNLDVRIESFIDVVFNKGGYVKILEGLQNTLLIAICGLIIGIVIGIVAIVPVIGWIIGICGGLIDLYVFIGAVLSVLDYCKVLK